MLGYDPARDVISLWNPHGHDFHPKSATGLSGGYPTSHGRFDMPLAEFFTVFDGIAVETTQPWSAPAGK